jgi:hypothetical protein
MSYVFAYHRLRPLKWLARVFHDEPCISHCIFIFSHKSYMILSVHCAAAHDVRACAAPSPTHTVTINIYHFKGSVVHRPPLVHPDCPLELFCTPTVPLRGHATTVCMGSEARQVLKPPSPAPCMAKTKRPVAPRSIQGGYQISIEGACTLHGSSGLQHGELPWPFFQDLNCRKTVFPTFARPMLGLEDAHTVQKVRPICPKHGRGSQGDWDSRASQ